MRRWLVVFIALVVPAAAAGQPAGLDSTTGLPLPSIGLPLPSIGLALPSLGLPRPAAGLAQAGPPAPHRGGEPARDRSPRGHRSERGAVAYPFFVYPFLLWPAAPPAAPAPAAAGGTPTAGRVFIDAQPAATAQIYVDGYYVGMPDDYPDGLELPAGPHAIDVRAPGFDSISTSIQLPAGRSISYRVSLTPPSASSSTLPAAVPAPSARQAAAASDPPPAPTTFYIIAGCYMGNVPPAEASLPAGCDPAKAVAVRP